MSAGKNSIFEVKNSIMKLKNRSPHSAYFEKYELECTGIPIWGSSSKFKYVFLISIYTWVFDKYEISSQQLGICAMNFEKKNMSAHKKSLTTLNIGSIVGAPSK